MQPPDNRRPQPILGDAVADQLVHKLDYDFGQLHILVYQQLKNYLLSPRLSQKTMELNAGVAFAAAMAGGAVGGFIGAFFALPIAAVIQAFLSTYSRRYEVVAFSRRRISRATSSPSSSGSARSGFRHPAR